jgi:hypothetical protein
MPWIRISRRERIGPPRARFSTTGSTQSRRGWLRWHALQYRFKVWTRGGLEGSGPACAGANLQGPRRSTARAAKGPLLHFVSSLGNAKALRGVTASDRRGEGLPSRFVEGPPGPGGAFSKRHGRQERPARAQLQARDP